MKTAKDWAKEIYESESWVELVKEIQLDAFKAGMNFACDIAIENGIDWNTTEQQPCAVVAIRSAIETKTSLP